ncbi:MAG TPA: ferritin-like domain-containing protein, partial [Pyrinomonadaceae bacterium]|nr:ferritin-like domain-containing protein [Pyrinomonadaceae bacterium]
EPVVNEPRFIPSYPLSLTDLLQPATDDRDSKVLRHLWAAAEAETAEQDVRVEILKFSPEAIDTFVAIETPEPQGPGADDSITTIGQFYTLIIHGLEKLEEEAQSRGKTIFTKDPVRRARQLGPEHYYGSGGGAFPVTDLESARAALGEIICQGEGFKDVCYKAGTDLGEYEELGHYFRFMQIKKGRYYAEGDRPGDDPTGPPLRVDWGAVYDMKPNPKLKDFKHDPGLEALGRSFNETYLLLLDQIQRAFTGEPEALQDAVVTMFDLKYAAGGLLRVPLGDGPQTAGPVFGPGARGKARAGRK